MRTELASHDVVGIRADNPGPLTLEGTNTWVVGISDVWVVDPGPDLADHIEAVATEVQSRGSLAGVALTHAHGDHSDAVAGLLAQLGDAPVVAMHSDHRSGIGSNEVLGGAVHGPLEILELRGHSSDHVAFLYRDIAFTGDALFANSSVFVSPGPGSLAGYLSGLQELANRSPVLLAPGHGPLINDPAERLASQIAHRLDRERRLIEAIGSGLREQDDLLDVVWSDVPEQLRLAAAVTLYAHLGKLSEDGLLPADIKVPEIPEWVV